MATRNTVAKIAGVLTLACMLCASNVQAGNLVCGSVDGRENENLIRMMKARVREAPSDNPVEMVKKIDEMFQDPATLALLEKNYTSHIVEDTSGTYFIAYVRTALLLMNAVLESDDGIAVKDSRRWVTSCLNLAKSRYVHDNFEMALQYLDLACANPVAAKLMLAADSSSDYNGFLRDIARLWLKAKLAQSKKLLQSRQETQQAQNSGDSSSAQWENEQAQERARQSELEQWRLENEQWMREMNAAMREAMEDERRANRRIMEWESKADALEREASRRDREWRTQNLIESIQGIE